MPVPDPVIRHVAASMAGDGKESKKDGDKANAKQPAQQQPQVQAVEEDIFEEFECGGCWVA